MPEKENKPLTPGGGFLIGPTGPDCITTPERFSDEVKTIAEAARDFMLKKVVPKSEALEKKEEGLMVALFKECGELGLLGIEVPEEYGGMGMGKVASAAASEEVGRQASFAVTFGGHTGIGTLPIVYFGTPAQREKYLPRLATGELMAAYALTEPGSGSDALAAKTRADLTPDGKFYKLSGGKVWISNAGWADLFVVFAQVEGNKFTGFIIERETPGFSIGAEERKMGLHGSSTCALSFSDAMVPAENVLGEIGQGHKIAFNVLNVGRFKLGAATVGALKYVLQIAASYAAGRKQFGKTIASFPLVQAMLARMAVRAAVAESIVYRTAGLIDAAKERITGKDEIAAPSTSLDSARDKSLGTSELSAVEEYAVESSILKVACSEMLDQSVDDCVQIHGGYGYSAEYPAERFYRDSRINRIFEGTNEINRMLVTGMLLKRAMGGRVPLLAAARKAQQALLDLPSGEETEGSLGAELTLAEGIKKAALLLAGAAAQKFGTKLDEQQQILAGIADLIIAAYSCESLTLRALAAAESPTGKFLSPAARYFSSGLPENLLSIGRSVAAAVAEGDNAMLLASGLKRFLRYPFFDRFALERELAEVVKARGGYPA
ncbi:MAG: acyl-CoA dehydrogenase family protein [candidate division Zixibacteria bacterium]|nr:acyl-CoA dehydrogenase family protein [candidate division Zixibacteria bacterium]